MILPGRCNKPTHRGNNSTAGPAVALTKKNVTKFKHTDIPENKAHPGNNNKNNRTAFFFPTICFHCSYLISFWGGRGFRRSSPAVRKARCASPPASPAPSAAPETRSICGGKSNRINVRNAAQKLSTCFHRDSAYVTRQHKQRGKRPTGVTAHKKKRNRGNNNNSTRARRCPACRPSATIFSSQSR